MTESLAFPLLVTLVLAAAATSVHRRLPPRLAARFVTLALVLVVLAALPTALMVSLSFLAHVPVIGFGFEWCAQAIGLHGSVPAWIGLPVLAVVGVGAVRTFRLLREHRALRLDEPHPIHVAHSHQPYAVTLPGRAGQIVISTAMVDLLDDDERRIVVAHERAHARYRHDRYLLTAELAAAALPPLRWLARRVTYSIERWADEAAAAVCGDRQRVAVTLGKVALRTNPATVAGFAGLGVAARMSALLEPPRSNPRGARLLALWSSLAVTAGFSLYQLHHLELLLTALCPH
ncbi:MAG TPA: M56 family metallopeptidase [Ilumatobacteraceae bacterium]|nr:M56 family metallopeptidase [Ilumatobacteraceae bacterium]